MAEHSAFYDQLHQRLSASETAASLDQPWFALAEKHLGDVRGKRLLEIGCGRGEFALRLLGRGGLVTAADFSPAAVEITRQRLARSGSDFEVLVADIQALPFADESFDVVVSLETLEHVPDPDLALRELVRVTRRGGRVLITTPNYLNLHGVARLVLRLAGRPYREPGDQPINHALMLFKRARALRNLGCRVDAVDGAGHYFPWPGGSRDLPVLSWLPGSKWIALEGLTVATRLT